jgi:hypothetical protein
MPWYKVSLTAEQIANGEEMRIQDQFNVLFSAAGGPKDMALFASKLSGSNVADLFFSPDAIKVAEPLIRSYRGEICEKPDRRAVALLVGHQSALEELL